jgi:hypothetical protein
VALHGATLDGISEVNGASATASTTFVISGGTVTMAETCPKAAAPVTATFSVAAGALALLVEAGGRTAAYTYAP